MASVVNGKKMMRHHNPAHFLLIHNCAGPVTNTTHVTKNLNSLTEIKKTSYNA